MSFDVPSGISKLLHFSPNLFEGFIFKWKQQPVQTVLLFCLISRLESVTHDLDSGLTRNSQSSLNRDSESSLTRDSDSSLTRDSDSRLISDSFFESKI